jgi:hypothetical protein
MIGPGGDIMKSVVIALTSLLCGFDVYATEFFMKTSKTSAEKIEINFEKNEAGDIKFSDPSQLERFVQTDKSIRDGWISRRPPSEVEQIVDAAFVALTGFLILGVHDSFDLNSELRLSTHSGVVMFFFPFRDHYLYAHCGGDHHLIATSNEPNEETLLRMKTLQDLEEICQGTRQQEPQQDRENKS